MITPETIKKMKQSNIGTNPPKIQSRLKSVWRSAAKDKREEILALADLRKASIERAYKTGNVSAKIIVAVSYALEVDPYYLVAYSDKRQSYSESLLSQFLTDLGYVAHGIVPKMVEISDETNDVAQSAAPSEIYAKANHQVFTPVQEVQSASRPGLHISKETRDKLDALSEDEIVLLLKSLTVQSGFSDDKSDKLAQVKYLLLQ